MHVESSPSYAGLASGLKIWTIGKGGMEGFYFLAAIFWLYRHSSIYTVNAEI